MCVSYCLPTKSTPISWRTALCEPSQPTTYPARSGGDGAIGANLESTPVVVLLQADNLSAVVDLNAEALRPGLEQVLRRALRRDQHHRVRRVELGEVEHRAGGGRDLPHRHTARHQFVGEPAGIQQFQCAGMDGERPGDVRLSVAAIQNAAPHPGECEFARQHQAGRACADDDDFGCSAFMVSSSTLVDLTLPLWRHQSNPCNHQSWPLRPPVPFRACCTAVSRSARRSTSCSPGPAGPQRGAGAARRGRVSASRPCSTTPRSRPSRLRVLRGAGIESESEFPFAAVHQLLRPVSEHIDTVPERQRAALRAAFGLSAARRRTDRFLVSIGILSLLSDVAEHQPVLCLDRRRAVARRTVRRCAGVRRAPVGRPKASSCSSRCATTRRGARPTPGCPSCGCAGLDADAAAALLAEGVPVAAQVRDLLVAGTVGQPAGVAGAARVAERRSTRPAAHPLPDRLPLSAELERVFLAQVHRQPPDTQTMLLLAAAEQTGDLRVVLAAAQLLGRRGRRAGRGRAAELVSVERRRGGVPASAGPVRGLSQARRSCSGGPPIRRWPPS